MNTLEWSENVKILPDDSDSVPFFSTVFNFMFKLFIYLQNFPYFTQKIFF